MIIDLPDYNDFQDSGISFLNLAWDYAIKLFMDLEEAGIYDWDDDLDTTEYWHAAQKHLGTAVVLVHKGVEFLLKSKIAKVSPYLLIAQNPSYWPRKCDKQNTLFSDFRTIDAQDLIRVHDTISPTRLSSEFISHYDTLRKLRNSIFHTVNKKLKIVARDVISGILESVHSLHSGISWVKLRRAYLETMPESVAFSSEFAEAVLVTEHLKAIEILTPAETTRFFGFNKKQRKYICYTCAINCSDSDVRPEIAQLHPNKPASDSLYCFICEKTTKVNRIKCSQPDCRGNVIEAEDNLCLTCYQEMV